MCLAQHLEARRNCVSFEERAQPLWDKLFGAQNLPKVQLAIPRLHVHDVNCPEAVRFVQQLAPRLIVVNGTNLLRAPYLDGTIGEGVKILNIHTGLSPYSRGGNCNLFCILHGQLQMVGVTVHHIDAGIDSGDIIYTDRPSIRGEDTFESLEHKVCRLGVDLLMLALEQFNQGSLPRHPQWTKGRLFLRRTGYVYEPYQRLKANSLLQGGGLIEQYLRNRAAYDESVTYFPPTEPQDTWRHPST